MNITIVDKLGSIGTLITAMACPVCWPLFATAGSALGLGVLAPYEGILMVYVFPAFVVIALLGTVLSYLKHKSLIPLSLGVVSGGLILYGFYFGWHLVLMYIGIFGLLLSSALSFIANKRREKTCN